MEVYDEDGNIRSDPEFVLHKWKADYESLFNIPPTEENPNFDNDFHNYVKIKRAELESYPEDIVKVFNEVSKVVNMSKNKKGC